MVARGYTSTAASLATSGSAETREFQAETRKLLDIVTNSIYTDKEVFLRELISNASDALEKYRYKQVLGEVADGSNASSGGATETQPLEINIITDSTARTLTIMDNGIGMTKDELISNLGTIARSGSKQFVQQLKEKGSSRDAEGIIGQFGVGFYSSFMVSDTVSVESRSASLPANAAPSSTEVSKWSSDGSGMYTIEEVPSASANIGPRGSRIVLHLKESCADFADAEKVKGIIKRYSSFVSFPVKVSSSCFFFRAFLRFCWIPPPPPPTSFPLYIRKESCCDIPSSIC